MFRSDIGFYSTAVVFLFSVFLTGVVRIWQAVLFLVWYMLFVVVVVAGTNPYL